MDFRLSSEQELLRESARRYLGAEVGYRGSREMDAHLDRWAQFGELGWLAMLVPEHAGGLGAKLEDIAILCEEMGRGLSRDPFIGAGILPARLIARCARNERNRNLLSDIGDNKKQIAVAAYDAGRSYSLQTSTVATKVADGCYQLSGHKTLVMGGAQADHIVVSTRIESNVRGALYPALFLIAADASGVSRHVYEAIDGVPIADFVLERVTATASGLLVAGDATLDILEDALDDALICLCAEALGGMDRVIDMTAEYLSVRKQFGKPLSEFQVLQHAVVEMSIEATNARSMLYRALAMDNVDPVVRRKAVAGCAIKVMTVAKWATSNAVHLHGGIGMTCEYPVGRYLQRALVSERMLGDFEHQIARYMK